MIVGSIDAMKNHAARRLRLMSAVSRVFPALLLVTAVLAGCSSNSSDTTASSADTTTASETLPADSSATEVDAPAADPPAVTSLIDVGPLTPEETDGPLAVTANGIGPFTFGMKADGVIQAMTTIFGKPTEDTGWGEQQAPCEGMGSRSRYVSWGRVALVFADGPTEYVKAEGEHLSSYVVFDDPDPIAAAERFVLDDGQPVLGRSANEMTAWKAGVKFLNSEIEGPIWSLGQGRSQLSGSMATPEGAVADRTVSVRAGLVCVD